MWGANPSGRSTEMGLDDGATKCFFSPDRTSSTPNLTELTNNDKQTQRNTHESVRKLPPANLEGLNKSSGSGQTYVGRKPPIKHARTHQSDHFV